MVKREILEIEALNVIFPGRPPKHAVNDATFSIPSGRCTGIVGGSGCGKTTIARAIVGLTQPSSGRILFEGRDIAKNSALQRRQYRRDVQLVFQDTLGALNPRIRVGDALREVLHVHRRNEFSDAEAQDACVRQCLADVELSPDLLARFPHEISGGQRQRVGIARALAVNPRVLIADEPVSALDVAVQAQLLKLLHRLLTRTGLTLVLIAHDLAVVRSLCDFSIVMDAGRIVEYGDPKVLFAAPSTPFTRTLIDSVPDIGRSLRARFGDKPAAEPPRKTRRVTLEDDRG